MEHAIQPIASRNYLEQQTRHHKSFSNLTQIAAIYYTVDTVNEIGEDEEEEVEFLDDEFNTGEYENEFTPQTSPMHNEEIVTDDKWLNRNNPMER